MSDLEQPVLVDTNNDNGSNAMPIVVAASVVPVSTTTSNAVEDAGRKRPSATMMVLPTAQAQVIHTAEKESPSKTAVIDVDMEPDISVEPVVAAESILMNEDFVATTNNVIALEQPKRNKSSDKEANHAQDSSPPACWSSSSACWKHAYENRLYIAAILLSVACGLFVLIAVLTMAGDGSSSSSSNDTTNSESSHLCPKDLTDEQLVDAAMFGNTIGTYCKIVQGGDSGTACSYYVQGRTSAVSGHVGIPRTATSELGTGCVSTTTGGFCYFDDPSYDLTDQERSDMCTGDWKSNAAAQLRWGMSHGLCEEEGAKMLTGCSSS